MTNAHAETREYRLTDEQRRTILSALDGYQSRVAVFADAAANLQRRADLIVEAYGALGGNRDGT